MFKTRGIPPFSRTLNVQVNC